MSSDNPTKKNLTSRVLAAGSWSLFGYGASQVLRLANNLIMTRLLVPEMFGLMAATQTFLFIITLVSDLGVNLSVIQSKRGEDEKFLNTAWVMQILRGALLMGALVLIALGIEIEAVARFFNDDSAYAHDLFPLILIIMASTVFINGFKSTNATLADRRMQLGRVTLLNLLSQIISLIVMISWALFYEATVWALVAGALVNSISFVLMSHLLIPGSRNKFEFEKEAFWEIFHFGKWVVVSSVLSAFYFQIDKLYIGYLESATVLGIYSIAFFIASAVRDLLLNIISKVLFPLFSEISRDNREMLVEYYYRIRMRTDALTIFCAGFLFSSGQAIILILYDDRYLSAGPMLNLLSLSLLFTAPFVSRALMLSIGNSKYMASLRAIQLLSLVITIPYLYELLGINGVIWALVIAQFLSFLYDLYYRGKHHSLRLLSDFRMYPMVIIGYFCGLAFNQITDTLGFY